MIVKLPIIAYSKLKTPRPNKARGFTLIELLVVIAIIAVLSIIGVATFSSVQKNARDAKRKADLIAISKAFEVNRGTSTYAPVLPIHFSGGIYPGSNATGPAIDPSGKVYCIRTDNTASPANIVGTAGWSNTACTTGQSYSIISSTSPTGSFSFWTLCTLLDDGVTISCLKNAL